MTDTTEKKPTCSTVLIYDHDIPSRDESKQCQRWPEAVGRQLYAILKSIGNNVELIEDDDWLKAFEVVVFFLTCDLSKIDWAAIDREFGGAAATSVIAETDASAEAERLN